ncbi:Membrane coat complex Retromer, subunit VPS5/SNX1, Sorting nexins, and related PX domain-containing proteins [Ceraceosorus bombacis]|uniref:Sorting nexin MVP1 n=1 Tax=Ceraceosorus bombacis TaxID=401625 RepID=A0A0P1BNQ7_9BASI|nr:Membrane coat complex Retromer, subunit VPS5/SNX1, Sorting nexins, and related PX domain-containing proteins [Ceraceosorus bombacis]
MSHFSRPGPSQAAGQGGDSDDEDPWGANGHITRAYNVKLDEPTSGAGRSGSPVTSDPRALLDLLPNIYSQVWQVCRRCEAGSSDEQESISIGQMNRILRSSGAGASVVEAIITLACQSARVSTHEHIFVSVRLRKETGGIYFLRHTLYSISSTYAAQDEATALLFGSTASASIDVSSKNRRKSWRPSSTSGDPDGLSGASEKWNVVRRYSDFTWLADCLIKRYPFRLLPILPPKRISIPIGGKQIAGSDPFLEARRRGLQRYLRAIVTHPVLRGDGLVRAFLTEKDSLTDWRLAQQTSSAHLLSPFTSTTSIPESLALVEECLSPCLSLPSSALTSQAIPEVNELQSFVSAFKARNTLLVERWSHLCIVFERLARRLEGLGLDHGRFSLALASLNETLSTRHAGPSADEERAVERTKKVTNTMESLTNSNQDFADLCSARASKWLDTLDGLKYQRDQHQAARDLVSRYERLIPDNVGALQKRIQASQKRQRDLASLISAPLSTATATDNGAEAESNKLAQSIAEDRGQVDKLMRRREHARLVLHVELRRLLPERESAAVDVVRNHAKQDLGLIAAETLAAEELVRSLLGA